MYQELEGSQVAKLRCDSFSTRTVTMSICRVDRIGGTGLSAGGLSSG